MDNPNLNLGKESTKQDCHREGREGRGENFRFTVAYSDLMALMQSNNEAFIQLSNERRESEKRRRSSVGRQSVGYEEESQAKQYF